MTSPASAAHDRVLVFDNVLGESVVSGLLDHVAATAQRFAPAAVYERQARSGQLNLNMRDCLRSKDLGPFQEPFAGAVSERAGKAARALGLLDPDPQAAEFEICAYGDGGHFAPHMDTLSPPAPLRVLTCVYYFANRPRRFTGGELRVFPWPGRTRDAPIDIAPETDRLVIFPSFLHHEVLPVRQVDDAWLGRRFNLTCWLCRPRSGGQAIDPMESPDL